MDIELSVTLANSKLVILDGGVMSFVVNVYNCPLLSSIKFVPLMSSDSILK